MFSVKDILKATGGKLLGGSESLEVFGVSIDSRTTQKGDVFIAIKGRNFDGHNFINQAIKKSAAAVVVSKQNFTLKKNVPAIKVRDTTRALGLLARCHRDRFSVPLIAITGSAGKTTTKEMIASVLATQYRVLKNIATQNNHIGVPMTLLKLNTSHQVVVVELGTNHFGEIAWLTHVSNPTTVVLTNIGESHLEFFRNLSGVFREKFDIIRKMQHRGVVVFNNDDFFLRKIPRKAKGHQLISYGIKQKSRYRAWDIAVQNSFLTFKINKRQRLILKTLARHNVYNALAAVGCGSLLKIRQNNIFKALKNFQFPKGRQQIHNIGRFKVIDDTANANPLSFRSAIDTLTRLNSSGRKILICGDMLELGSQSIRLHRDIGDLVAGSCVDLLMTVGKFSRAISISAKKSQTLEVHHYAALSRCLRRLKQYVKPGDTLLIKGSRKMRMERLLKFLKETEDVSFSG